MNQHRIAFIAAAIVAAAPVTAQDTSFNPAISVIIDGAYYGDSVDGRSEELARELDGFVRHHGDHEDDHDDDHGHAHGGLSEGFNLREVEIAASATIDPYFDGFVTLAVGDGALEIEEAFISTRALPAGLQLKAGKFLSDIGYLNKQHPHAWLFVDRPLMSELLFGDHGLQETGMQLAWVPPTPIYSRVGFELLQGDSETLAAQIEDADAVAGTPRLFRDRKGPRLVTAFAKVAPDLGYDHAVQAGVFAGRSSSYQESIEEATHFVDFDGEARFWGADVVYKYDAGDTAGRGSLVVQGEYARRTRTLDTQEIFFEADEGFLPGEASAVERFRETQDGYYLQAVYGIAPRWTAGIRLDVVGGVNETTLDGGESWDSSDRVTAMVAWMPTEFSRLRLQFTRGDFAVEDGERASFNQFFVQWQMSLGAHGAHAF
ncbi:MAG: TonB-dependent receptor [Gammaproteobacteria bacterium]